MREKTATNESIYMNEMARNWDHESPLYLPVCVCVSVTLTMPFRYSRHSQSFISLFLCELNASKHFMHLIGHQIRLCITLFLFFSAAVVVVPLVVYNARSVARCHTTLNVYNDRILYVYFSEYTNYTW